MKNKSKNVSVIRFLWFFVNLDDNTGSQLEKESIMMNIMVHCNRGSGLIEPRVSSGPGSAAQKYEPMERFHSKILVIFKCSFKQMMSYL